MPVIQRNLSKAPSSAGLHDVGFDVDFLKILLSKGKNDQIIK